MVLYEVTEYFGQAGLADNEDLAVVRPDLARLAQTVVSRAESHFGI